jgi:7-carboxy-7-deazaguanine synthase
MKTPLLAVLDFFHSIQGEGTHTGRPMAFLRLPGCNVRTGVFCTTWSGHRFKCDTPLGPVIARDLDRLLNEIWESHVCITGGEPFTNPTVVKKVTEELLKRGKWVHIETNGTLTIDPFFFEHCFIACSPKKGWQIQPVVRSHELRLLIADVIPLQDFPPQFLNHPNVYLCPISYTKEVRKDQVRVVLDQLRAFPNWRLGVQLHKYIKVK